MHNHQLENQSAIDVFNFRSHLRLLWQGLTIRSGRPSMIHGLDTFHPWQVNNNEGLSWEDGGQDLQEDRDMRNREMVQGSHLA